MRRAVDLTNNIYGYLKVIKRVANETNGHPKWECLCRCGKKVDVRGTYLRDKKTRSCGCLLKERTGISGVTGVVWNSRKSTWLARPTVNGKRIYLGYAKTIKKATLKIKRYNKSLSKEKRS